MKLLMVWHAHPDDVLEERRIDRANEECFVPLEESYITMLTVEGE